MGGSKKYRIALVFPLVPTEGVLSISKKEAENINGKVNENF